MQNRELFKQLISKTSNWAEIRYHKRRSRAMGVRKGEVAEMSSKHYEGVGIRVLVDGTFGFASTSELTAAGLTKALKTAEDMARALGSRKKHKIKLAPTSRLAKQDFILPGFNELETMPTQEKFDVVRKSEQQIRGAAKNIESSSCQYTEVFEDKIIMTTDGADTHMQLVRPELRFVAVAADGSKQSVGTDSVGVTGGWECLFINRDLNQYIENATRNAVDLLKAPLPQGGRKKVILSPSIVGLLSHEAIGHTVEADFVNSGSVAQGKLGQMVASPMVSLCDSGDSEYKIGAGGVLPVDDEGVLTQKTYVIRNGKLENYLHNRETAAAYGVEPAGNARAWEFSDEPLIRMRNTYIEPGNDNLDDMIAGVDDGYFIDGPMNGQADATGEFMFAANRVRKIKNGKLGEIVQKVTLSGVAFDTLKTVDAVSKDFKWDLGSGHCGKGQPAKVDAGGPYLRCEILVGGGE